MAEDDEALDLVGHQLPDVPPLALLVPLADKDQELVAVGLIGGEDAVEDLGEEAVVELGDDDPDELGLAVGQDAGHLVLLVVELHQGIGDDALALLGQGVRVVEVPGDGGLGEVGVLGDVVEGDLLFRFHISAPIFCVRMPFSGPNGPCRAYIGHYIRPLAFSQPPEPSAPLWNLYNFHQSKSDNIYKVGIFDDKRLTCSLHKC